MVVVLGDNILENSIKNYVDEFRKQQDGARILLKEVSDPERFGVPVIENDKIVKIEEKPIAPKTSYAVIGVYMYASDVFDIIDTLKPSDRGELEITDVNNAYIEKKKLYYNIIDGWWTDAGTYESLLRANILCARKEGYDINNR